MELSEQDMKALEFREELLKLCKKYKCTIEDTDDGTSTIIFDFQDAWYYADTEKYNMFEYDEYDWRKYLIDKYIKSNLHEKKSEFQLRMTNKNIGVFSTDYEKALFKILRIKDSMKDEDVVKFVKSKYVIELRLKDGIRYKWINPNDTVRGNKCSKAIIDRGLTLEQLQNVFLTAIPYFSIDDVEMF